MLILLIAFIFLFAFRPKKPANKFLKKKSSKPPSPCVYTIRIKHKGRYLYKVGYSKWVDLRLADIKQSLSDCGISSKIEIISIVYRDDAFEWERAYHIENRNKRACLTRGFPRKLTGSTEWYLD